MPIATNLFSKEALREGGDEADLDDEADNRLTGGQDSQRTIQGNTTWEEATSVERGHAEYERGQHA